MLGMDLMRGIGRGFRGLCWLNGLSGRATIMRNLGNILPFTCKLCNEHNLIKFLSIS
jgi:hypothetical protein